MKTAISIPDPIFQSAEIMAHQLAISGSELFTKAISEYLVVNVSQLITLDKNFLTEQIGKLNSKHINFLNEGIKLVLAV